MLDRSVYKKIRQIEVRSRKAVNQLFAGQYRSVFKGQGLEFHEVREYIPGDDIRFIDWNVSARLGHPYVKKFIEERQQTLMLVVDISASQDFGSVKQSKNETAAEIAAVLAFSAIKNNDLVGLLMFSDKIEKYIPPKKGKRHVLRVIREILFFKRESKKTNLPQALRYLNRVCKKNAVTVIISDFFDIDFEKPIRVLSKHHDVIPIIIKDRFEKELPKLSLVDLEDPETGNIYRIDLSDAVITEKYKNHSQNETNKLKTFFRSLSLDNLELTTDGNYALPLTKFFKARERRLKH
ncbi:hypothetical protein A3H38_04850 [candidate division WOR-1 bacterium RIFCSPLOWO2_02_FULL_46_20]|uniref:DUF58 domain-containing protein n=2 Tax=Saganbacteria TaxID=1703751 RepID=A0A1F4R3Y8_UNCSA|nr:MAG: hypothetical protein A3J44_05895 [candidate division WOR-1 bacterium RIFCSPHIGHO2_02_FULL_45_12]OGC02918.1 MAG: hypothetical protein A3H38_04850 [candidate division WOR-1 bacterium RIFCSPLOWO2_02_FULL_46_20]OGC08547.1 MAG: hypothetical protein A3F86_04810 [candidate division WOR-1 bacterium RIFCSPLOWO2_12_FULL_45_9]